MPLDWFPYETTEFHGQLEILDRQGRAAVFRRRQRVRFLENNVSLFIDRVWGHGVLFAGYSGRHLRVIDIIKARKGYAISDICLERTVQRCMANELVSDNPAGRS